MGEAESYYCPDCQAYRSPAEVRTLQVQHVSMLACSEWTGRPLDEWFYPLRGRFGEERKVERWKQTAQSYDRLVRFRTPTGPVHARMMALRRFDAAGRPVGWHVLLGVVVNILRFERDKWR